MEWNSLSASKHIVRRIKYGEIFGICTQIEVHTRGPTFAAFTLLTGSLIQLPVTSSSNSVRVRSKSSQSPKISACSRSVFIRHLK